MRPDNHFAAYLAQQAVEQLVLALVLAEGIHVPRSQHHQLDWIVRHLPEENSARQTLIQLTWLQAFATTYRYPRPSGRLPEAPDPKKLGKAVAITRDLLDELRVYFGVDLSPSATTAASRKDAPRRA